MHNLVPPQQTNLIPTFRGINVITKIPISEMYDLGIIQKKIYTKIVHNARGDENIGYLQKDVHNVMDQHWWQLENDTEVVLALLHGMLVPYLPFFVAYTIDKDEILNKRFGVNVYYKFTMHFYGHMLSFDTTYKLNKYNKPFAIFVEKKKSFLNHSFRCSNAT